MYAENCMKLALRVKSNGKKMYILVNEYDSTLATTYMSYWNTKTKDDEDRYKYCKNILGSFLGHLKTLNEKLDVKYFVTGIYPFTDKWSIFNNKTSLDESFASVFGYTPNKCRDSLPRLNGGLDWSSVMFPIFGN